MLEHNIISLKELYRFVQNHRSEENALNISGRNPIGNKYCTCCKECVSDVPEQRGLYLWGFYNEAGFWVNVYIGLADFRKTARLKERLYKELTAERASIWRAVYPSKNDLLAAGARTHPRMWPKYRIHWERALRKAGSTHILWVATPHLAPSGLESVESDIIEAMNPTGNRRRRMPPANFRKEAAEILDIFRETIHETINRKSGFHLKYHDEFWKWVGEAEPTNP